MATTMPRLNVYVTEEIMRRLKAHADATGAPTSEIVRRALDRYLPHEEVTPQWPTPQSPTTSE